MKHLTNQYLKQIYEAKDALLKGGVIAIPTETVYGLAILYNNIDAYNKLNKIKRRPEDKPYTMMVKSVEDIEKYAYVNEDILRIAKAFLPGSLTLLLKAKEDVPTHVTHGSGIIGIRIPDQRVTLGLLEIVDIPLLVPSANRSGEYPCRDSNEVALTFPNELDYIITGASKLGQASTIVDLSGDDIKIIREGPITYKDITNAYYDRRRKI